MSDIILNKTKEIEYLQFKKLLEFQNDLIHAYTLKNNNVGFKRYEKDNTADISYDKLCNAFNINKELLKYPNQQHTDNICEYNKEKAVNFKEADGIITNLPNIATTLTFSDCLAILLYEPKNKVIANIHSGWKGTVKKIGAKAVNKMINKYDCRPENIICCFGPSIRKDHFLVNDDVKEIFENEFQDIIKKNDVIEETEYRNEKGKQYRIDTVLINKILMKELGLIDENIIDSNLCTVCNSNMFHSRRVEGKNYQANASLMMLKSIN